MTFFMISKTFGWFLNRICRKWFKTENCKLRCGFQSYLPVGHHCPTRVFDCSPLSQWNLQNVI